MSRAKKPMPVLKAVWISKASATSATSELIFEDVSLSVYPGELVALKGFSDTAATALLNCLSGLEEPDNGSVFVGDRELTAMRESDRTEVRQRQLGLVSSSSGVLLTLTVAENIEVPLRFQGMPAAKRQARVDELLKVVGLVGCSHQPSSELSADQCWRVALGRALANQPEVLMVSLPSEGSDGATSSEHARLLSNVVRDTHVAAIVATSDSLLIERSDRVLGLVDGRLSEPDSGHINEAASPSNSQLSSSEMIEVPTEMAKQNGRKG